LRETSTAVADSAITALLEAATRGEQDAEERLLQVVYSELHRMARGQMSRERAPTQFQTTELVHETYLRLFGGREPSFESRAHFFAVAAEAMRRILVERARRRLRLKRGGDRRRVPLDEQELTVDQRPEELLAIEAALGRLEDLDPKMASVVKLRLFAGLDHAETAAALGCSVRTVHRRWDAAKAWLRRELDRGAEPVVTSAT
jgi:RNA polymerase sigma factor (TIGR02999 family)